MLLEAGADPALATLEWAAHHLTMVAWKCARYERRHPPLQGHLLTVPVVLDQLKRRWAPCCTYSCLHCRLQSLTWKVVSHRGFSNLKD